MKKLGCFLLVFLFSLNAYASGLQVGITLPVIIKAKDPENIYGYRAVAWYQPERFVWNRWSLYFAAGAGHWWVKNAPMNKSLNIFAVVPVLRYYFSQDGFCAPYFEVSIGPSYLTRTKLNRSNFGEHFSFQDEVTLGARLGQGKHWYVSISALHYSNGSLSAHNSGITIPAILNVGYQF